MELSVPSNVPPTGNVGNTESTSMENLTEVSSPTNAALMAMIGVVLFVLIMACIIGNLFVIVAILTERDLKSRPQYYLIISLAIADLLVGVIVAPLGAWSTITRAWPFGVELCDLWISMDVLVCTSSILHLVAIALDRYWGITDVSYIQNRVPHRIFTMLGIIWLISLLISLAPIFGWKDQDFYRRVTEQHVCLISQQISYQIFSTSTAFYIPLCAIIFIYYKIMSAAKSRFKRERERRNIITSQCKYIVKSEMGIDESEKVPIHNATETYGEEFSCDTTGTALEHSSLHTVNSKSQQKTARQSIKKTKANVKENAEMKRERKAWRTLAIITGTFVACWTPFFLVSVYRPICRCKIPILLESITNWLGYLNSALNPIIYTIFSNDFRTAFKRILARLLFLRMPQPR